MLWGKCAEDKQEEHLGEDKMTKREIAKEIWKLTTAGYRSKRMMNDHLWELWDKFDDSDIICNSTGDALRDMRRRRYKKFPSRRSAERYRACRNHMSLSLLCSEFGEVP